MLPPRVMLTKREREPAQVEEERGEERRGEERMVAVNGRGVGCPWSRVGKS